MFYLVAALVALLSFTGTALAASGTVALAATMDAVPPDASWIDLAKPVLEALVHGNPLLAGALAIVLAVALARKYLAPKGGRWAFLSTDAGGTGLTFLGALGTALAAAVTAGTAPSWALIVAALTTAAVASGGYTGMKRLVAPFLRWLVSKLPAKARPFANGILSVVLWAFESKSAATKVAEAEAAGAAAVEAKPSTGTSSVVKTGKSFP